MAAKGRPRREEAGMYARLSTFRGSPDKYDEAVRMIQESSPRAKEQPGLIAGYWGLNREAGEGFTLILWEDEASLKASETLAATIREAATQSLGANFTSVATFEIVAQA
jgi:heme-degrading monooxygenase HmoA